MLKIHTKVLYLDTNIHKCILNFEFKINSTCMHQSLIIN